MEFFLLLQPAPEERGYAEKIDLGNVRGEKANNLFENKFAGMKKIVTFAARFGRTGSWLKPARLKSEEGKTNRKNKIYFIWKFRKDPYLCTPNGNEGETKKIKWRMSQRSGKTKRLKRAETGKRRLRLKPN